MADQKYTKSGGNPSNSTEDPRVIWEDGQWAIIEAGDCWDGLARSKTRDSLGDAVSAPWDPGQTTMPGPQSVKAKKLVKVALKDLAAQPPPAVAQAAPSGKKPNPKDYASVSAPPSPFMPKPWAKKDIPEYPHICHNCGGRYYQGAVSVIHEKTERDPVLKGACPGNAKQQEEDAREAKRAAARRSMPHARWP